jgi:hypothetical protein
MISTTPPGDTPFPDKVLALGFHLYIEKGCPEGAESEVWLEAERLLKMEQASGCDSCEK